MTLPVAPTIIKCSLFQTLNGQPIMNRFHVKVGATNPSAAECNAVAVAVANWWAGNVQDLVGDQLSLREVHAQSLAEVNGPQATFSTGLPAAGALTSPTLPGNVAFCVSLRSGLTGRSARGRWYWGGLTESQVSQNQVDGGTATSIVAASRAMRFRVRSRSRVLEGDGADAMTIWRQFPHRRRAGFPAA